MRSLWPLLTGPVPRRRRPRLADDFYSSRSLWLYPLLAWVSEPWLPAHAREAAAGFVQRALLPFLCAPLPSSASSSPAVVLSLRSRNSSSSSSSSSPRAKSSKKVRLVGNRLCAVEEEEEEEEEEEDVDLGVSGEEKKVLLELRSAAAAVTGVAASSPDQGPPLPLPPPPVGGRDRRAPAAPTNPFVRPSERAAPAAAAGGPPGAGDGSGWSQTPWERRLGVGSSAARSVTAGAAGPQPWFDEVDFTRASGAVAAPPLVSSTVGRASQSPRGSSATVPEAEARPSSAVGREQRGLSGSRTGFSGAAGAGAAAAVAVASDGARSSGKRVVTAAEAAAARSARAQASAAAAAVTASTAAAVRPRGSVVERWR